MHNVDETVNVDLHALLACGSGKRGHIPKTFIEPIELEPLIAVEDYSHPRRDSRFIDVRKGERLAKVALAAEPGRIRRAPLTSTIQGLPSVNQSHTLLKCCAGAQ